MGSTVKASEFGLKPKQVGNVDIAFTEKTKERELLSEIYGQIIKKDITKEVALEAREVRLRAVKIKSGIATIHKTQKEFALAFGKYCDAWKRKETEPVQQMIDGLMEVEKHEERMEQKRLDNLQKERANLLSEFVEDAFERNLSGMEQDVWDVYLATKKKAHLDKLQAEKDAEEKRLAKIEEDKKEQERIRKENEKLRKEAEKAKEKEAQRLKDEAIRKAKEVAEKQRIEDEAKKERLAYEANIKAERDAKERIEKEERAKRKKVEDQLKAKVEDERKKAEDEKKKVQAELNKGDKAKVSDMVSELKTLKSKYSFKSEKNQAMYSDVGDLFDKIILFINKKRN